MAGPQAKPRTYRLSFSEEEMGSLIVALDNRIDELKKIADDPELDAVNIVQARAFTLRLEEVRKRAMTVWCK